MKKIIVLNSENEKIVPALQGIEKVEVISEGNQLTNFKSQTQLIAEKIRNKIFDKLSLENKKPEFEIFVSANENYNSLDNFKTIIFINENKEKIKKIYMFDFVEPLENKIVVNSLTENKNKLQIIANRIQNYLANTYDFKGQTKITAVCFKKNALLDYNITISGKGTNDFIVKKIKQLDLQKLMITNKENEMDKIIINAFEES